MTDDERCSQCNHDLDPHILIATTGDPLKGGVIVCQVKGCRCFSTWSPSLTDRSDVVVPSPEELEDLRLQLQKVNPE